MNWLTAPRSPGPPTSLPRWRSARRWKDRILYAGLRSHPIAEEPVARLWHAATPLREHRGHGHTTALVAVGIDGQEAHVLAALAMGKDATEYGRLNPLTPEQLAAVMDGLRDRGLVDAADQFTDAGRDTRNASRRSRMPSLPRRTKY